MTYHILKLQEEFYDAVLNGVKTFEVRKADRDYKVGDTLHLTCYRGDECLQQHCRRYITYILRHEDFPDGVPEGYVILGIRRPQE